MKTTLLIVLAVAASIRVGRAQTPVLKNGPKNPWLLHSKNHWLVGAGPTYFGVTAKAGRFIANRWWAGAEVELHELLSSRQEVGLFTRYYTGERMISGFIGGGVSYGHFQAWDWDFDNVLPTPPLYRSTKLNALVGLEVRLTKRVSLEGVAKAGRLTNAAWIQPSFQGSVNYYLGR